MKKYQFDKVILKGIAQLLAETAIVNVSSFSLRKFIRSMKQFQEGNCDYMNTVVDSLLAMVKESSHKEIFVFNGQSQSGISVVPVKELPSEGYSFFGWFRLERRDQSSPTTETEPMCIYKLGSRGEQELELFLCHNQLQYRVI